MSHNINQDQKVAVATDYFWLPMDTCPRGVKVQLLNLGGVAVYGNYNGPERLNKEVWNGWAPLPKRMPTIETSVPVEESPFIEEELVGECNEILRGIHKYLGWMILVIGILWWSYPHVKFH